MKWIRQSISEISEPDENTVPTRKENRSQSMVNSRPIKGALWGGQRSFDGTLNYEDPFKVQEEEDVVLDGTSEILHSDDPNYLSQDLPARLIGSVWHLLFSTGEKGPYL